MPIDPIRAALAIGAAGLLSACASDNFPALGAPENFGQATEQTLAAQVINPDPVYETPMAVTSGEHAAQAIERYRTDKVKEPDNVQTSEVLGSTGVGSGTK